MLLSCFLLYFILSLIGARIVAPRQTNLQRAIFHNRSGRKSHGGLRTEYIHFHTAAALQTEEKGKMGIRVLLHSSYHFFIFFFCIYSSEKRASPTLYIVSLPEYRPQGVGFLPSLMLLIVSRIFDPYFSVQLSKA